MREPISIELTDKFLRHARRCAGHAPRSFAWKRDFQGGEKSVNTSPEPQISGLRDQRSYKNSANSGPFSTTPGNLRNRRNAWWAWQDSNPKPGRYGATTNDASMGHFRLAGQEERACDVDRTVEPMPEPGELRAVGAPAWCTSVGGQNGNDIRTGRPRREPVPERLVNAANARLLLLVP